MIYHCLCMSLYWHVINWRGLHTSINMQSHLCGTVAALRWRHNGRDGVSNHLMIVYSTVYSGVDRSKHQGSASLAFVWGIHWGPVNFPHKWPVTRKLFPFDEIIFQFRGFLCWSCQERSWGIGWISLLNCNLQIVKLAKHCDTDHKPKIYRFIIW